MMTQSNLSATRLKDGLRSFDSSRFLQGLKWGLDFSDDFNPGKDDDDIRAQQRYAPVGQSNDSETTENVDHFDVGWHPPQHLDPEIQRPSRNPVPFLTFSDADPLRAPPSLSSIPPPPSPTHTPHAAPELLLNQEIQILPQNASSLQPHDGLSLHVNPLNGSVLPLVAPKSIAGRKISGASLHSPSRYPLPKCHPDTRRELLHTLEALSSPSGRTKHIFWLFGPAGSGKSAVAQAFAESCENTRRLGAAVFCSRAHNCSDISQVMFTIAHQLSSRSSAFHEAVSKVVENEPHIFEESLSTQYDKLVYRPSLEAKLLNNDSSLVIVLDGLDECSDRRVQAELIELLSQSAPAHRDSSDIPPTDQAPSFLWFICSRPEPHLKDLVTKYKESIMCANLSFDDAESVKDVRQVFLSGFRDIRERFPAMFGTEDWPMDSQLERLLGVASGFFMAALSILAFIGDDGRRNPKTQLAKCLEFFDSLPFHPNIHLATIANPLHDLDTLYMFILADVESHFRPTTINVLRLCAANGTRHSLYTAKRIADTLGIDQPTFYRALQSLHSVIDIPTPDSFDIGYPRFYHSTFPDFLRDAARSGAFTIFKNQPVGQYMLVVKKPPQEGLSDILTSPKSVSFYSDPEDSESSGDDGDDVIIPFSKGVERQVHETEPRMELHSHIKLPDPPTVIPLTEKLASVLRGSNSRKALRKLRGGQAQLMVDFLYNVVREKTCPIPWLQKHALIALYKLSKDTLLYPHCYVLKDIVFDQHESGGAFSDIHRGHHRDQQLCLKVVRLHQKSDTDAMLKIYAKEAILWGQLHHPNIVPFYGIYYLNNARRQVCLVSPWMRHGNLVEYLKNNPSSPRIPFVYDVTAGLNYMHSRGLVHSDLKGLNVLVNDSGRACITDFGLSFIRTDQTLAYTIPATTVHGFSYHWAAPELLDDGARSTMASDVWALGCVYYEILTGNLPYHGLSDAQIIRRLDRGIIPERPPHLTEVSQAESIVWKLVERVWVLEAEKRPRCQEILQDLEAGGLSRDPEVGSPADVEHDGRRSFEEAMKHGKEMPIDLIAVGNILDETQRVN
ncbi:hypothetical protein D9756_006802 [Leucocoprinus leucothites]|uniref:Protein kinase domain-containing protein n=1 Tax=Leucocoprinus leucothites TaxID=201217 RepID=A0A8H5LH08_9AGAR|nr:hypothetical protein D9756_006802 [Leucoagaricus leucothites]